MSEALTRREIKLEGRVLALEALLLNMMVLWRRGARPEDNVEVLRRVMRRHQIDPALYDVIDGWNDGALAQLHDAFLQTTKSVLDAE